MSLYPDGSYAYHEVHELNGETTNAHAHPRWLVTEVTQDDFDEEQFVFPMEQPFIGHVVHLEAKGHEEERHAFQCRRQLHKRTAQHGIGIIEIPVNALPFFKFEEFEQLHVPFPKEKRDWSDPILRQWRESLDVSPSPVEELLSPTDEALKRLVNDLVSVLSLVQRFDKRLDKRILG